MSKDRYWRAISIDCISPELFPDVALYLKSNDNYVMYKDAERKITLMDKKRESAFNIDPL